MADNSVMNSGSGGDTIRTEDRGTYKTPVSLIDVGGTSAEAIVGDSGVGMPVKGLGTAGTANAAVLTVQGIASMTPVQVGDNSSSLTVDAPVGTPVFVRLSDGSSAITTLPVSIAGTVTVDTEMAAAGALADNTANPTIPSVGSMPHWYDGSTWDRARGDSTDGLLVNLGSNNDVTLGAALPAGTNNIGDVDVLSIAAGDNNIGNVDIVTVPTDPFGANADAASATGSISAKLRFIAATGIPITGTVAVTQSGTWDEVGINDSGNSITVDNGGTFAVQVDGSALTALQLIDDGIFTDDTTTFTAGTTKGMVAGGVVDDDSTDAADEGDVVAFRATKERKQRVVAALDSEFMQAGNDQVTPKFAIIDAATSGDNTLVSAVASKKLRVLSLYLVAAGTVNVRFESGASGTALSGQMNLVANTGFVLPFNPVGWFETAANTLLNLELSGAVSVDGGLTYIEVD